MGDGFDDHSWKRYWAQWHDDHPDYRDAHVKLIDALRDYVMANEDIESDMRSEGDEPSAEGLAHTQMFRSLLKELEGWSFDPTLGGRVKECKDG